MSTGYCWDWEGIRQVCATLLGARHERLCGDYVYLGRYQVFDLYLCCHASTVIIRQTVLVLFETDGVHLTLFSLNITSLAYTIKLVAYIHQIGPHNSFPISVHICNILRVVDVYENVNCEVNVKRVKLLAHCSVSVT